MTATPKVLKLGKGTYGAVLEDLDVLSVVSNYKKGVAGRYRALHPDNLFKLFPLPALVSRKYDGELWFLVVKNGERYLTNPKGKVIDGSIPILDAAQELPDGVIIAGELFAHTAGARERVGELRSVLFSGEDADTALMRFGAFDILQDSAQPPATDYSDRLDRLTELLPESENLFPIPCETCESTGELKEVFERYTSQGQSEGLIARVSNGLTYKIKPEIELDAVVLAYTAKAGATSVRSLLLGLVGDDERFYLIGGVGASRHSDSEALFKTLSASEVESTIRRASVGGSLYRFVEPKVVVKITCTDIQSEAADGSDIEQLILNFDGSTWTKLGTTACPSPLHPSLSRVRDDKSPSTEETSFSQLHDYLLDSETESPVAPAALNPSVIIRRQVWSKETKGVLAIRKLVVWKTNKEDQDKRFPAYVVHWTDFSAGRASPLNREVKPAPSESVAIDIADAMIEKNIKKGWELVN